MALAPAAYRATSLAIGAAHACALREGGVVECWGRNDYGELGDATMVSRREPAPVQGLPPVVELTAGMAHVCARTAEGAVYCWGDGELGEIGDGAPERHTHPTRVVLEPALAIVASGAMTCARLDAAGAERCWGSFPSPDPETSTGLTHAEPMVVTIPGRDVPELASDTSRTCVIDRAGATWCWGLPDVVGLDTPPMRAPTVLSALGPATELANGGSFLCAALGTGVSCWGIGAGPVLGLAVTDPAMPAPVPRMRGGAHIAAGQSFVCAAAGGETRCAGYGELVDASGGIWPLGGEARVLPMLQGARMLAAGSMLVCAIADGDEVRCLGYRSGRTDLSPPS